MTSLPHPATKRARGRPKKAAENPDCEVATKGYVKCVARKYHDEQTIRNMKHRQGSEGTIMAVMWGLCALLCLAWWLYTKDIAAQMLGIVTGLLLANAVLVGVAGWDDTMREASKHVDCIQPHTEPPCEPKRGCE